MFEILLTNSLLIIFLSNTMLLAISVCGILKQDIMLTLILLALIMSYKYDKVFAKL